MTNHMFPSFPHGKFTKVEETFKIPKDNKLIGQAKKLSAITTDPIK